MPCAACGRLSQWPHPELGCSCGTVLRVPVAITPPTALGTPRADAQTSPEGRATPPAAPRTRPAHPRAPGSDPRAPLADPRTPPAVSGTPSAAAGTPSSQSGMPPGQTGMPSSYPGTPSAAAEPGFPDRHSTHRPAFPPRAIRTARDAVTVAALYLRWLGYRDIRRADQRPPNGIGLAAHGLLAQVDPTVRPAAPRDVECLWLTSMTESADCVYFSLAGYTDDARARADALGIPLFVLDLAGVPQPVNDHADTLNTDGAPEPDPRPRNRRT
ncbi:hypothetical protein [Streptomyces sp. NPDC001153]